VIKTQPSTNHFPLHHAQEVERSGTPRVQMEGCCATNRRNFIKPRSLPVISFWCPLLKPAFRTANHPTT